jgi:hypothetical protein
LQTYAYFLQEADSPANRSPSESGTRRLVANHKSDFETPDRKTSTFQSGIGPIGDCL